jgi:integrase/recombinase XerD
MSELSEAVERYLSMRRRLGFKLVYDGDALADFVAFCEQHGASTITTKLAVRWATLPQDALPAYWARRLTVVRGFAKYRSATDPETEVPPSGLLPHRYRRKSPHLYSDQEIALLIEAAQQLPSRTGLRARTYTCVLTLLAITGMRASEVTSLDCDDVDLDRQTLVVRCTKFGKSRLVPLHPSSAGALQRYVRFRQRHHPKPKCSAFFVSEAGIRLTYSSLRDTFTRLSHEVGLRGLTDSHGPRLHDFRHSFAVRTLLEWYRAGVDVEPRMPVLATYLGHAHVSDTYWYISAAPELMRLAAERVDVRQGVRP